ncbi:MAG TPA: phosphatase PAP2 family protein [Candidatus Eisenbacteria bacterium]|nr:phosphatase PAP2 family protein [Candidatus Eisenbacteria bacterium]
MLAACLPTNAAAAPSWARTIGDDLHGVAQPRTLTVLAVGAVAAGASLIVENPKRQAALFESGGFDGPSDIGNEYGSGVTLAALSGVFLGTGYLANDRGLKQTGSEMFRSLAYSTLAVTALKVAIHRKRPNGGAYSFPSGHTTTAFAMAPVLASRLGPSAGIPAFILAGATGIGRMEDHKHYLSDVVFGAALGLSIGMAVTHHDGLPANLEVEASPRGAGLTYHF